MIADNTFIIQLRGTKRARLPSVSHPTLIGPIGPDKVSSWSGLVWSGARIVVEEDRRALEPNWYRCVIPKVRAIKLYRKKGERYWGMQYLSNHDFLFYLCGIGCRYSIYIQRQLQMNHLLCSNLCRDTSATRCAE